MGNIPNLVRVKMLKDFQVDDRHLAKKGKYGTFDESVAKKMIKAKAAEEIVAVNSIEEIGTKKPYIEVPPEPNPTQQKQEAAGKITKEEKKFTPKDNKS